MGTEKLTPNEHLAFIREEIYHLQLKNIQIKKELEAQVKGMAEARNEAYEEIIRKDKRIEELEAEFASIREGQHWGVGDVAGVSFILLFAASGMIFWGLQLWSWIF